MSYYIGFRFGWIRLGRRMVAWHDGAMYPTLSGRALWGVWKVWIQ